MTNQEFKILSYIGRHQSIQWTTVLNEFLEDGKLRENEAILKVALADHLIEKTWQTDRPPLCSIKLTDKGVLAVATENERRLQSSNQTQINDQPESTGQPQEDHEEYPRNKKQERKQNFKKIVKVVGWVLGVLASIATILQFVMLIKG